MYKAEQNTIIPVHEELQNVIEFVSKHWETTTPNNPRALEELITSTWNSTSEAAKYWLSNSFRDKNMRKLMEERMNEEKWVAANPEIRKEEIQLVSFLDAIFSFALNLSFSLSSFNKVGLHKWDYSKFVNSNMREFKKNNPDYKSIQPLHYSYTKKEYVNVEPDFNKTAYQENIESSFKGIDSAGATHGGFAHQMSASSIAYNHTDQGRTPLETLVSSVATHALFVVAHNNTIELKKDLAVIYEELSAEKNYIQLAPTVELNSIVHSPLLKAYLEVSRQLSPNMPEEKFKKDKHFCMLEMLTPSALSPLDQKELKEYRENTKLTSAFVSVVDSDTVIEEMTKLLFSDKNTKTQKNKL